MDNKTEAGPGGPAQDQSGTSGEDPVAEQQTDQTIEVLLVPTDNEERLMAVRAGGTPRGVTIRISPTAPGLTGVTADGAATWRGWVSRGIAFRAVVAGEDITDALKAHQAEEAAEKEDRRAREARKDANRAAVEAAGLKWGDTPYEAASAETPEEAIEATRQVAAEKAEQKAARQKLIAEREAEIVATGLPEGYIPSADTSSECYRVHGPDGWYSAWCKTAGGAASAARNHAEELIAKAARAAEREAWIAEHGSDGLKDRIARGYNCQRRYMEERLNIELPGWTFLKWDDQPDWSLRDRSCPSDTALVLEDEAKDAGFEATTQWAVWKARYDQDHEDDPRGAEVVVVEDFHGYLVYHETDET